MAIFSNLKRQFSPINYFAAIISTFVVVQGAIWLLSQYTDFQFLKMGWILFLFATSSLIVSIFIVGLKLGELNKEDYIFLGIQFLSVIAIFIFIPRFIPEIFSTYSIQVSDTIREATGSIVASIGQGIGVASNGGL